MRIATWNLERGGRLRSFAQLQEAELNRVDADITVLTEPPPELSITGTGVVAGPADRPTTGRPEAWVSVTGIDVEPVPPPASYGRLSVVARARTAGESVIVYGSVLPWKAAPHQSPELASSEDEQYSAMFERILRQQVADVHRLQRKHTNDLVIWAGDFNQSLVGSNAGGSNRSRQLLVDALADLGFVAWNRDAPHAKNGLCAIDLICGPAERVPKRIERFNPTAEGRPLSDHAGYVVEI